jgi:hypothetical protein
LRIPQIVRRVKRKKTLFREKLPNLSIFTEFAAPAHVDRRLELDSPLQTVKTVAIARFPRL